MGLGVFGPLLHRPRSAASVGAALELRRLLGSERRLLLSAGDSLGMATSLFTAIALGFLGSLRDFLSLGARSTGDHRARTPAWQESGWRRGPVRDCVGRRLLGRIAYVKLVAQRVRRSLGPSSVKELASTAPRASCVRQFEARRGNGDERGDSRAVGAGSPRVRSRSPWGRVPEAPRPQVWLRADALAFS